MQNETQNTTENHVSILEDLTLNETAAQIKGGAETVHLYLKSNGEDIQGESMQTPRPTSLGANLVGGSI